MKKVSAKVLHGDWMCHPGVQAGASVIQHLTSTHSNLASVPAQNTTVVPAQNTTAVHSQSHSLQTKPGWHTH